MLCATTADPGPPPGALTFKAVLDSVGGACARNPDGLSVAALLFFAAATSYYSIRERAARDARSPAYDRALADEYSALAVTANDIAQRAAARSATCADISGELRKLLDRHRDDPRDATYVEMNREIREFHERALAVGTAPTRPRVSLRSSLVTVGLIAAVIGIGGAAAVAIVRHR